MAESLLIFERNIDDFVFNNGLSGSFCLFFNVVAISLVIVCRLGELEVET
ncbi:hypothetical protein [Marinomonas sp. A3A]|nr:hypothetical protein [Marinomonas sp. A3A]